MAAGNPKRTLLAVLACDRSADEAALVFSFAKVRFLCCLFRDSLNFASINHWKYTSFLDHPVNEAAVN